MIIFATIFGVGFFILILNLIFGGDHDISADTDVDAHAGGPNIFSTKVISLLMVGFGATSFGFRATTEMSMFQCSMAGIAGALVVGALGMIILKFFYSSQASSTITDNDIIGQTANLIDSIAKGQNGQISCIIRGREITYLARSLDGQAIKRGIPVTIVSKTGNIVTVKPITEISE